jgi:hypothetical protein
MKHLKDLMKRWTKVMKIHTQDMMKRNSLNYDGDTIPMHDDEGKLPLSVTINIDEVL